MSSIQPDQDKTTRRRTYRIHVGHPLQFAKRHKVTPTGKAGLRNLSDSGCALHSTAGLEIGDRLALVLELPQPVLITDARVVWIDGALYGIEFVRVSPLEQTRLRRFLWKQLSYAAIDDLQPVSCPVDGTSVSRGGLRMVP